MAEIEQEVRELTGNEFKAVDPHPDGYKKNGDDGRDHEFGKSTFGPSPKKEKLAPGGVSYIKTLPLSPPVDDDVEIVEVYFGFKGTYVHKKVASNLSQAEIERLGCEEFQGTVGLIEFRPPSKDLTYRFKAMYCRDRDDAAWTKCDRTDSADEEWVLLGQELSDAEITRIMEERWFTPLKTVHPDRPMEQNQVLHFTRRPVQDDEEEEQSVPPPMNPLDLFRDLRNWKTPRPLLNATKTGP
jgi:hypothetical protein